MIARRIGGALGARSTRRISGHTETTRVDGGVNPDGPTAKDYERLVSGVVNEGMRMKLDKAKEVLEANGVKAVQMAHPRNLMKELFSDEGSGTYITL